jgi:hypothetical protein
VRHDSQPDRHPTAQRTARVRGLSAATQRYIRRSLDIGLGRRDACSIWARNPAAEAAAIRTQYEVYQAIAPLRAMLPEGPAADGTDPSWAR